MMIGAGIFVALVAAILGYISWTFYKRHTSHRRYLQLQEQQKREQDELMSAAAERRAALNARAQQRLDDAAARNADRGNDEVYKLSLIHI